MIQTKNVCENIQIIFFSEVIKMKLGKDIALMMLGGACVLAYQKYNKPVMHEMNKITDQMMHKANKKLEDMM